MNLGHNQTRFRCELIAHRFYLRVALFFPVPLYASVFWTDSLLAAHNILRERETVREILDTCRIMQAERKKEDGAAQHLLDMAFVVLLVCLNVLRMSEG